MATVPPAPQDSEPIDSALQRLRIDRDRKRSPRRRQLGRWVRRIVLLIIVIGALAGLSWYQGNVAPLEVEVARAQKVNPIPGGGTPVVTASGYVIPRKAIDVSSKIVGRVKQVLVDRGDVVKAGSVVLRIEDDEFVAQVKQAEAALAEAEANLARLEAGSRPQEIATSKAAVNSAQSTLEKARREYERFKKLRAEGVISEQELDGVRTTYEVAEAALRQARKQSELVDIGPRKEDIAAAAAQKQRAQANLDYARTQLDFTVIKAPIDGTILEKVADEGELVTNTDFGGSRVKSSVVSMADLTDLQVEIDLNESDLAKIRMGQPAVIDLDSLPGKTFHGEVDELAPQADRQKGTVQVKVKILDPTPELRPEVNARVTFLTDVPAQPNPAAEQPRVFIPARALLGSKPAEAGNTADEENTPPRVPGASGQVYLAVDGKAEARTLKLGTETPDGVEVLEGLKGGEALIIAPLDKMKPGRTVKIKS